jgi:hypothetical protein
MTKIFVGVWIYLCGILGTFVAAGALTGVLSVYPRNHMESYGPVVPAVSRVWAIWLPHAPALLWSFSAISVAAGLYLWRSRRPLETRLFAAAVISAANLFLAMFCVTALLVAYFYLPKVANGA